VEAASGPTVPQVVTATRARIAGASSESRCGTRSSAATPVRAISIARILSAGRGVIRIGLRGNRSPGASRTYTTIGTLTEPIASGRA